MGTLQARPHEFSPERTVGLGEEVVQVAFGNSVCNRDVAWSQPRQMAAIANRLTDAVEKFLPAS